MAEDSKPSDDTLSEGTDNDLSTADPSYSGSGPRPNLRDSRIATVFANDVYVDINKSDISVTFLHEFSTIDGGISQPSVRVVFSHHMFVEIVGFLRTRAEFLEKAYGGSVPDLSKYDQTVISEAFEEMYRKQAEQAKVVSGK